MGSRRPKCLGSSCRLDLAVCSLHFDKLYMCLIPYGQNHSQTHPLAPVSDHTTLPWQRNKRLVTTNDFISQLFATAVRSESRIKVST